MTQKPTACWGCFPATRIDLPALAVMSREIFPSAWTETALHIELQREEGRIWLARSEDVENAALAGFIVVRRVGDDLHVEALGVSGPLRRRGVGGALMTEALAWAHAEGLKAAQLEHRASNDASRALYESLGFVVVGRRPRYYRDGEDASLMSFVLTGPRRSVDSTPGAD